MPLAGGLLQWCEANDTAIKATDTEHVVRVKVKTAYKPFPENNRFVRLWRWFSQSPSPLPTPKYFAVAPPLPSSRVLACSFLRPKCFPLFSCQKVHGSTTAL
jgi:hypothetical protein